VKTRTLAAMRKLRRAPLPRGLTVDEDHDRIEELLAGYVLLGLSGEDATRADRLLSEHVPSCPLCRETMAGFQAVVGELGLATCPARPPDLLLPRIRRSAEQVPVRRRRRASLAAVTAGVAALMGLGAFSMSIGSRMSRAETHVERLLEVIQSGATPVSVESQGQPAATPMVEVSRPELERMYMIGQGVPQPAGGLVYQLWLGSSGNVVPVRQFVPEDGLVLLVFTVDTTRFDEILITEERAGEASDWPSSTGHRWHAFLPQAG